MSVPLPAGLTVRPPTMDDIPIMVEFITRTSLYDTGESTITEESLRRQFTMPGADVSDFAWLIFTEDTEQLVSIGLTIGFPPYVQQYSLIGVDPDYRDEHLIDYGMQQIFTRAETYIPKAPENARVTVMMGVDGRNDWIQGVLNYYGFEKVRGFFEMQIDMETLPPIPHFPDGILLRPFNTDSGFSELYDAVEDAFQDHYGHVDREKRDEESYQRWLHNITRGGEYDPSLFYVLVEGDEIVGMSLCQPDQPSKPDIGYVSILGIRRQWRGKGLAKALLYHTFTEFYKRGTFKVSLGVDAQSLTGATKLYEKVGMRVVEESFIYEKCVREGENLVKESL